MTLLLKPNPASGVPIYRQLKQQIRHAVETGALRAGEALPTIRALAERLVINVNTAARVYRELEAEGLLDLRQGIGAFVAEGAGASDKAAARIAEAQPLIREFLRELQERGLAPGEIRRLVQVALDAELDEPGPPAPRSARSQSKSPAE